MNTKSLVSSSGIEKELGSDTSAYRARACYFDFEEGDMVNITDRNHNIINVAVVTGLTDTEILLHIVA